MDHLIQYVPHALHQLATQFEILLLSLLQNNYTIYFTNSQFAQFENFILIKLLENLFYSQFHNVNYPHFLMTFLIYFVYDDDNGILLNLRGI